MSARRVQLTVAGQVQGVGYRWFARETGRKLNIAGWVRNNPDGSVEIAASGTDANIEAFLTALRAGPPRALVATLQLRDAPPGPELVTPFDIRR